MVKNFVATTVDGGAVFKVEFQVDFFVPEERPI